MANKTPIMVSLSGIGFKLLNGQGFYAQGHCHLSLLTRKSIRINCRRWPTTTPITLSLPLIGFKILSGQGFYALCHCDLDF